MLGTLLGTGDNSSNQKRQNHLLQRTDILVRVDKCCEAERPSVSGGGEKWLHQNILKAEPTVFASRCRL